MYGWSPLIAAQGHKASWVCWRCRWTVFLLPPPWWTPRFEWDLSIPGICWNFEPPKHLLCKPGDRLCHCGVPGCPPRSLAYWWKVVPQRNDTGVPGSSGGGRCWDFPIISFPHLSAFQAKMHIQSSCKFCKDVRNQLLRVDSGQIPGGDTRQSTWRFPQVSGDPDVNRTMNLVWVLALIADVKKLCQW